MTAAPRPITLLLLALSALGAMCLAACSGSAAKAPTTTRTSAASPTSPASTAAGTTSAAPTTAPAPTVNPLTGLAPVPTGPVIAVKIDDTSPGRPQHGIDQADVVYIEQAEGGLSRLVAVFETNKPQVEPVRSVRASDPELLSQYGPITLVASGGGGDALPTLDASILHSVIHDRGAAGFHLDGSRSLPYNTVADLMKIGSDVTSPAAKSVGWQFLADAPAVTAAPAAPSIRTTVGGTAVRFDWDAALGKYVRLINGSRQNASDGNPVTAVNVIVQFCTITANPGDRDVNGTISQYTHSIGTGQVVVFRNGKRLDGTWSRSSLTTGTTLSDAQGNPIPLAPGNTWVALVATGASLTSG